MSIRFYFLLHFVSFNKRLYTKVDGGQGKSQSSATTCTLMITNTNHSLIIRDFIFSIEKIYVLCCQSHVDKLKDKVGCRTEQSNKPCSFVSSFDLVKVWHSLPYEFYRERLQRRVSEEKKKKKEIDTT